MRRSVGIYGDEPLTTAQVFRALERLAEAKVFTVALGGGEPLLRTDIFDIVAYGSQLGLNVCMATNGSLLTEENVRRLEQAGLYALQVSLDGASSASHDGFRRFPGLFRRIMQGFRYLAKTKIKYFTSTVLYKGNFDEIEDIVFLSYGLGCTMARFISLMPIGAAKQELRDMDLSYDQFVSIWNRVRKLQKRFKKDGFIVNFTLPFGLPGLKDVEEVKKHVNENLSSSQLLSCFRGCDCARARISITADGNVYPCESIRDPRFCGGNIVQDSLDTIWQSPGFQRFREASFAVSKKCKGCDLLEFCGGGCRAVALSLTGKVDVDPRCKYLQL